MIDLRVLTFLCVCKHMNYTRAAEELNMSQPAVSQHIHYLENYYEVKLFNYKNKNLQLTEQGMYLKKYMETICHDCNYIKGSVQSIQKRIRLKIGATLSIGEYYLPDKLSSFMQSHPKIDLSVTIADTAALLNMLDQGEVDILLCEGYFNKNDYGHMLIKKEDMCIFCSSEYDCGDIENLESLFNHHLLIREKGSGTRETFERYLYDKNFSLDNFIKISEITSPHLIVRLLLDRQGVSVLYRTVGASCLADGTLKEIIIPDFKISHEFNAVWKKNTAFNEEYKSLVKELFNATYNELPESKKRK